MSIRILDTIKTHSTIVVGTEAYEHLVREIKEKTAEFLAIDATDDEKNLLAENIKVIQDFIKTKSNSPRYVVSNRRIRSTETQNRILKLLEEGGENTFLIFVLETDTYLLPTVASRVQVVTYTSDVVSQNERVQRIKEKCIKGKNFKELATILELERGMMLGTVTNKNLDEYLDMV